MDEYGVRETTYGEGPGAFDADAWMYAQMAESGQEIDPAGMDVHLRISNKQYSESLEPHGEAFQRALNYEDGIEVTTDGKLYRGDGITYISYDEFEDTGLRNMRTLLRVTDDQLEIRRCTLDGASGDMDMVLREGMVNITKYNVPMNVLELEIYTNRVRIELSEEGYGRIFADYRIKMLPFIHARNQLEIHVKPGQR